MADAHAADAGAAAGAAADAAAPRLRRGEGDAPPHWWQRLAADLKKTPLRNVAWIAGILSLIEVSEGVIDAIQIFLEWRHGRQRPLVRAGRPAAEGEATPARDGRWEIDDEIAEDLKKFATLVVCAVAMWPSVMLFLSIVAGAMFGRAVAQTVFLFSALAVVFFPLVIVARGRANVGSFWHWLEEHVSEQAISLQIQDLVIAYLGRHREWLTDGVAGLTDRRRLEVVEFVKSRLRWGDWLAEPVVHQLLINQGRGPLDPNDPDTWPEPLRLRREELVPAGAGGEE